MDYVDIQECKIELELLGNGEFSLYKLLNFCRTKGGEQLLQEWISKPLKDIDEINKRLDMVGHFMLESELRMNIFAKLKKMPNLTIILKKFTDHEQDNKSAKLEDCVKLYYFANIYLELANLLEDNKFFYDAFAFHCENSKRLIDLIAKSIDLSSKSLESEYRINPSFDEALMKINNNIIENDKNIEELRKSSSNEMSLTKELQLLPSQTHGFVFEGSKKEIHNALRENPQLKFSIVSHLQTSVKITCPNLKRYSQVKLKLSEEYLLTQTDLEAKIIEYVAGYIPYIKDTLLLISNLDAVLSLAHACFSAPTPYCRPLLNTSGIIDIKGCRHPCLENHSKCIENDIKMKKFKSNLVLITGPNMGGKITYLRQVALCIIMAHIGCYVPAESANITIVDSIMARIGAGDAQLSGLSTFMAEMKELAVILEKVTPDSFLIIDELGRGTSTSEGLGIAWGLVEYLSRIGCFVLFATHFSELTHLKCENVSNYHTDVHISEDSIEMKYKIVPGAIGFSFGIEIAKMAGLSDDIIEAAYKIKTEKEEINGLLNSIDKESILNLYSNL